MDYVGSVADRAFRNPEELGQRSRSFEGQRSRPWLAGWVIDNEALLAVISKCLLAAWSRGRKEVLKVRDLPTEM